MSDATEQNAANQIQQAVDDIVAQILPEREREIISRRFGLYGPKETLEQVGDMLGITRERVRQLEKSALERLKTLIDENQIPSAAAAEKLVIANLAEMGRAARMHDFAVHSIGGPVTVIQRSQIAFIAELTPTIYTMSENDHYYQAAIMTDPSGKKDIKKQIDEIIKTIKTHGVPISAEELHKSLNYEHPSNITALASISKKLAELHGLWGLAKWPTVNPKTIRDKIFVILSTTGKPMHFSEIAQAIRDSSFKRRDVTTQAIHNELIKDKRFVLIGRGIYALDTWGYTRGTVSDIIAGVLKEAGEPLHRDEIVKRVMAKRKVKETTVLLNLQAKPQFQRSAKATYILAESPEAA